MGIFKRSYQPNEKTTHQNRRRTPGFQKTWDVRILLFLSIAISLPTKATLAFQPNVIRIGTVEIHPSISFESTYNDNISLTQPKVPDGILMVTPGIECLWGRIQTPVQHPRILNPYGLTTDFLFDIYLSRLSYLAERGYLGTHPQYVPVGKPIESTVLSGLRFRKYSVSIKYEPAIYRLIEHQEFDSTDHNASIMADYRLPSGFYLRVNDEFLNSTTINSYYRYEFADFSKQQVSEGIGFTTNLAAATIGYNFYTHYVLYLSYGNYFFSVQDFSLDQLVSGLSIPSSVDLEIKGVDTGALKMYLQNAGIFVDRLIGNKTNLSFGYIFGRLTGNMDDFSIYGTFLGIANASVRLAHDPRDAFFHEFRFGFQRVLTASQYVFGWPVPKTTLEGMMAYQIREFDHNELIISLLGQPIFKTDLILPSFKEILADLKLHSMVSPKTSLTLYVLRQPNEDEAGTGNVSINWEAGASITCQLRNKLSLNAMGSYRYVENTWERALESHAEYVYTAAFPKYQIQDWLSAQVRYEFLARMSDIHYNEYTSNRIKINIVLSF